MQRHLTGMLSRVAVMLSLLSGCSMQPCFAQSICDSVTVAQSNEIIRLRGEITTREASITALDKLFKLQQGTHEVMTLWQDRRYEKQVEENTWHERFFVAWVIISTIILFIKH